jgi:hypothetical protein
MVTISSMAAWRRPSFEEKWYSSACLLVPTSSAMA